MATSKASVNRFATVSLTVVAWLIVSILYAFLYVVSILTSPVGGDAYAMTWQFQLLMFSIFRLPWLVMALPIIIILEFVAFEIWIQPRVVETR